MTPQNPSDSPPAHEAGELTLLVQQLLAFVVALWSSPGRGKLTLLTVGIISTVCATALVQLALNAWNGPFYDALQQKNLSAFSYQLLVFAVIASGLLILNVAQAWLREMIKLETREWLTRDLFAEWLKPGRATRLAYAGEIGINPDQRIHEDARRLSELSADLGIGFFQASLLLTIFIGVLWTLSSGIVLSIGDRSLAIPGYMVWCALIYAATGSWLTWLVGRPLVGMNAARYARESELRFALVQTNQHAESIALAKGEAGEQRRLNSELDDVLAAMRLIVGATARLTWITAGYGWIAIVAPIVIAAPGYFSGQLSFGELMIVAGAFFQVNQSLRWFVDNFGIIADWRATLLRVMGFRHVLLTFEDRLQDEGKIEYAPTDSGTLELRNVGVTHPAETAVLDASDVAVSPGDRVLVVDKTHTGNSPLCSAILGLWPWGTGKLYLPAEMTVMILRQRPYFPMGSLRAALAYPADPASFSNSDVAAALDRTGLAHRIGALDTTARWETELTRDEQARLSVARLLLHKPNWVFSDDALDLIDDEGCSILSIFEGELAHSVLMCVSRRRSSNPLYSRVLHLTTA